MNTHIFKGNQNSYFPIEICNVKVLDPKDIRMEIQVTLEVYKQIRKQQLFNLYSDKIEPSGFMDFTGQAPIEIELRLDPTLVEALELSVEIKSEAIQAYVIEKSVEGSDNLFIYNDSWFVLSTVQEEELPPELAELGNVKTGFQTTWRNEL